jgi:uncharacterized protein YjbJ (UPF0337 family)
MKLTIENLVANLQQQLTKFVGRLLVFTLVWQIVILPGNLAIASPLLGTSADSISKQVTGKAEQIKGSATESIGKMQSGMEDRQQAMEMKAKDGINEAKIKVDNSNARIKNAADKGGTKVNNFFGK